MKRTVIIVLTIPDDDDDDITVKVNGKTVEAESHLINWVEAASGLFIRTNTAACR